MLKILKDPLVHFLVFGVLLFGVNSYFNPPVDENLVIDVTPEVLAQYVQDNSMTFDEQWAQEFLASMDEESQGELLVDYVRSEALYREALARGLEKSDNAVRWRLVQKLSYLLKSGVVSTEVEQPTEDEMKTYFHMNADRFAEPARVTFTHIYYDFAKRGFDGAFEMAEHSLEDVKFQNVGFEDAAGLGDKFEYHQDYINVTPDIVSAHFNPELSERLYSPMTPLNRWIGPFESLYGVHIFLIADRTEPKYFAYEDVKDTVRELAYEDKIEQAGEKKINEVVAKYKANINMGDVPEQQ